MVQNSQELSFTPGEKESLGEYAANVNTAGSLGLVAQIAIPCLLFQSCEAVVRYTVYILICE